MSPVRSLDFVFKNNSGSQPTEFTNTGDGSLNVNTGDGAQNNNNGHGTQYNISFNLASKSEQKEGVERLDLRILKSLAFDDMNSRHSSIKRRHKGTCLWVTKLEEYRSWESNNCGLLWIRGKPGVGKSTLMAFLLEALGASHPDNGTIYLKFFFHARGKELQHTVIGMFRALLFQIIDRDESIRSKVREIYRQNTGPMGSLGHQGGELSQSQLERAFEETVLASALKQQVVIFIDALDEAGATSALELATYFHELNENAQKGKLRLKICISCRHYPMPSTRPAVEITVEDHNYGDITNYLRDNLFTSPSMHGLLLANKLIEQSGNMFQWVRIILPFVQQKLAEGDSSEAVFDWLKEIPTPQEDMNETYQYILEHVIADWNLAQSFLFFQWVYLAERPLTLAEIRYALTASNARAKKYPKECHGVKYPLETENLNSKIKALSGGLAEVVSAEDSKQVIQVIHQSVNDFLYQKGLPWMAARARSQPLSPKNDEVILECQKSLYQSCLDYLTIESLQGLNARAFEKYTVKFAQQKEDLQGRPFIHYAVVYLFVHAGKAQDSRPNTLENDLRGLKRIFELWLNTYRTIDTSRCPPKDSQLIHIATAANMSHAVASLLTSNPESIGKEDSNGNTVLHIASQHGHVELAALLKQRGSNCLARNKRDETPLVLALQNDHLELARWLIEEMKDLNTATEFDLALQEASYKNQRDMIQLLKAAGANISFEGGKYGSALQAAASLGSIEVVRILLNDDAKVNSRGGKFGTALQAAAFMMETDGVKLLLQFGAGVNQRGGIYDTPLQAAATRENLDIVKSLLDAGAKVNLKGGRYGSAIQAACASQSFETMELLLEAGADVDSYGDHDLKTIQAYSKEDWLDAELPRERYDTALQSATVANRIDVVRLLLHFGANVNQRGSEYQTALYTAARFGRADIVKCLIDAQAKVTLKGGVYGTALQAAAAGGWTQIVKMLIDAGANVNAHGGIFGSALCAAASKKHYDIAKALIEARAEVHDQVGRNPPRSRGCCQIQKRRYYAASIGYQFQRYPT
ncbi:hypothetical protein N7533_008621 [Penicillium manginii]|uniref:uncharacterized protein n=1 Tax=Penicillium manginii TaxID=203109 RepID=UPI0025493D74|nr:uncharacterized protein N7533_008621 [Penicillium manginii]KAJ5743751.1 hypothetical protein N7533_008621 [Penicillium manginii]